MKNKTKKILAGMVLGCVGGASLVGCAPEFTQEQMDKIVSVVENSDVFMDETLKLLDTSNKQLDAEEAAKLYEYATYRLLLNKDNVWDNMKVSLTQNYGDISYRDDSNDDIQVEYNFFKNAEGVNLFYLLVKYKDGNVDIDGLMYNLPKTASTSDNGNSLVGMRTFTYDIQTAIMPGLLMGEVVDGENNYIVDCKILENGNYFITAAGIGDIGDDLGDRPMMIDCEITQDGHFVSKKYYSTIQVGETEKLVSYWNAEMKFEYGVLTDEIVSSDISKA